MQPAIRGSHDHPRERNHNQRDQPCIYKSLPISLVGGARLISCVQVARERADGHEGHGCVAVMVHAGPLSK